MSLYQLHTNSENWTIKKFDEDYNLESEYIVDEGTCSCPAGARPTCRHREMFPEFWHRDHVDDGWFLEFDANGDHQWHPPAEDYSDNASTSETSSTPTTTEQAPNSAASADTTETPPPAPSLSGQSGPEGGVISSTEPPPSNPKPTRDGFRRRV